jgi:putative acetyltransferase
MEQQIDRIRQAGPADDAALAKVMFAAIREGPSLYTEAQRRAWQEGPREGVEWSTMLARQHVVVAERAARIVGFMTLEAEGYINLAFVRPDVQRGGVFTRLYHAVETQARRTGLTRLRTHASLMAEPAFLAMGFHVIARETVPRGSEHLPRTEMEKELG